MDEKTSEKKARLLAALEQGMVMVHLDARRPGVLVPPQLRQEAHLRLNVSYRFDPPDLCVGDWGVRCTLSFSGSRFTVAIPWSALFALTSHVSRDPCVFPDDLPPELIQQSGVTERIPVPAPGPQAPRQLRPQLVLHETRDSEEPAAPPEDEPPPARKGHLRVVK